MSGYSVVLAAGPAGRPEPRRLQRCLDALAASDGPIPERVVLVDDRPATAADLALRVPRRLADRFQLLRTDQAGHAAALNLGWRACTGDWVTLLTDGVVPSATWRTDLIRDLDETVTTVGAVRGRVHLADAAPSTGAGAAPGTAEAATIGWAVADMTYRRLALERLEGFDERLTTRAAVELALRLLTDGWDLESGRRQSTYRPPSAERWARLPVLADAALLVDDALLRRLYGPGWEQRTASTPVRRRWPPVATGLAVATGTALLRRQRAIAAVLGLGWLATTIAATWSGRSVAGQPLRTVLNWLVALVAAPALVAELVRGAWLHRYARPWTETVGPAARIRPYPPAPHRHADLPATW